MEESKGTFLFGFALCMIGMFGLFGHFVGGDSLIIVSLAIMVFSFCFELLALFCIMSAFFWYQVFGDEIVIIAVLGLSAILFSALSLFSKKGLILKFPFRRS